ncbi:hypothetical protein NDU88_008327 [Pleurodeles waltl]|uniref:Uncharacterized protein n=1 Tax=Pleurodeles waltl TaxID=8319 RepID=A0AAV7PRK5_PLEWA|nr:hypothetical protein NDU88_008327 [Pleurodeles waltl]
MDYDCGLPAAWEELPSSNLWRGAAVQGEASEPPASYGGRLAEDRHPISNATVPVKGLEFQHEEGGLQAEDRYTEVTPLAPRDSGESEELSGGQREGIEEAEDPKKHHTSQAKSEKGGEKESRQGQAEDTTGDSDLWMVSR